MLITEYKSVKLIRGFFSLFFLSISNNWFPLICIHVHSIDQDMVPCFIALHERHMSAMASQIPATQLFIQPLV